MIKSGLNKKIIASVLCANMLLWNTPIVAMASNISGFDKTSGTFNISGENFSGKTQFRKYDNFDLSQGDIANLIYKEGYDKFINLVKNQVQLNGILNTMKDNSFYNGHAIFVSPNGIVVGASGVLNVGSLSLLTPSINTYNSFADAYTRGALSSYADFGDGYKSLVNDSKGNIVVNGKIIARKEVNLYGSDIKIEGTQTNRAGIIAGVQNQNILLDNSNAQSVFNNLVSNNITNANKFSLQDGKISIVATGDGSFANNGTKSSISIKNSNIGANKINITAISEFDEAYGSIVKSDIDISKSTLTGDDVTISAIALANADYDIDEADRNEVAEKIKDNFGKVEGETVVGSVNATANVNIEDSVLNANNDINLNALAAASISHNANLLPPTLFQALVDVLTKGEEVKPDSDLGSFFKSGIFKGYVGPRSNATITVKNSELFAQNDINVNSMATSSIEVNSDVLGLIVPIGIYGIGTGTVAKSIIDGSVLTADNAVSISAFTTNSNNISISTDSLAKVTLEDFAMFMLVSNNVESETEAAIINGSTINAPEVNVYASNLSSSEVEVSLSTSVGSNGEEDGQEDGEGQKSSMSTGTALGVFNRSNNNVKAHVDDSTLSAKNVNIKAQSLNVTSNSAEASLEDESAEGEEKKNYLSDLKEKIGDFEDKWLNHNLLNDYFEDKFGSENPLFHAGGVFLWNDTNNSASASFSNSTLNPYTGAKGDLTIESNIVDLVSNSVSTEVGGTGKFGIGAAVIVNNQHNTSKAFIDKNSKIYANNVLVNATTELPMNAGTLTFGIDLPYEIFGVDSLKFGVGLGSGNSWNWNFERPNPELGDNDSFNFGISGTTDKGIWDNVEGKLIPTFDLDGFFNNSAKSVTGSETTQVAASLIYNSVENNTSAYIDNSTLNVTKDVTVNAANSVVGFNAAGMVDALFTAINSLMPGQTDEPYEPQMDGKYGLGANILLNNYNNNASATISGSTVISESGDVNVQAANEETYATVILTGGQSESLGIDGSVHVQNLTGSTIAAITDIKDENGKTVKASNIKANNISVTAGKAHMAKMGSEVEVDEDSHMADLDYFDEKNSTDIEDKITNVVLTGAWNTPANSDEETPSFAVGVGAGVTVSNIDRSTKSVIENSTIEATNNLTVSSKSTIESLNIAMAGAFTGGTSKNAGGSSTAKDAGDAARSSVDIENIFGDLFDPKGGTGSYASASPGSSVSDSQGQFSLSAAGSVIVTNDSSEVSSSVTGSTITVGNEMKVSSEHKNDMINITGGLGKAGNIGAGGAVIVNKQGGSVKSTVDGSTITFNNNTPKLSVTSNNANQFINIALGVGASVSGKDASKGFQAAIGGSAISNTIDANVESVIKNSSIKSSNNKNIDVEVKANAKTTEYNIAGGGSFIKGNNGSTGVGAGAAVNHNNIKNTITAAIEDSTLSNINNLNVLAGAENNLYSFAIAGSMDMSKGSGFDFDGAVNVDYLHNTVDAHIGSKLKDNQQAKTEIDAVGNINVDASSKTKNIATVGTLNITTAQNGFGFGGNVAVNTHRNTITAAIEDSVKITRSNNISVSATSKEDSMNIAAGAAVSTGKSAMASANVVVNMIDNTVNAKISGDLTANGNVGVKANDETKLSTKAATLVVTTQGPATVAGAANVDIFKKSVSAKMIDAKVNAGGDVSVIASSQNLLGGDAVADEDGLLNKDAAGNNITFNDKSDFGDWDMFYDIAAGGNVAVSGTVVYKTFDNDVEAEINNSVVKANNLTLTANDYSIRNIIIGTVGASKDVAIAVGTLIVNDTSRTTASVTNGSTLTVNNAVNISAKNEKKYREVLIAGGGSAHVALGANAIQNTVNDTVTATVNGSTITATSLNVEGKEDIDSVQVVVTVEGSGTGASIAVNPSINKYEGNTTASIVGSTINDAAITLNASNMTKATNVFVSAVGTGTGFSGSGIGLRSDYLNTVNSYIDNSTINTPNNITINADNIIDSDNWLISAGITGVGATVLANVIINNVQSTVSAGIKNSTITNAGAISINANKGKKDKILNVAGTAGITGEGGALSTNVIYNIYDNNTEAYISNTSIANSSSITVGAYSDRELENYNFGMSAVGVGGAVLVDAIVNQIDSTTYAYIDAKSKNMKTNGVLSVKADDVTKATNIMGFVSAAVIGGAAGANVNLFYSNNTTKAELLSATGGHITAGSAEITAKSTYGLDNTVISAAGGFGAIASDITVIEIGKRGTGYSNAEKEAGLDEAIKAINDKAESKDLFSASSSKSGTGSIARINGNLTTTNNIKVESESVLKGANGDTLTLDDFKTSAGVVTAAAGVKSVKLANNSLAEISGGKVVSNNGNIDVNAKQSNKVKIESNGVNIAGVSINGNVLLYQNSSETVAQIKDATLQGKNINVTANSTNKAEIINNSASVGGVAISFSVADINDSNKSYALISGNTNILDSGKLTLHATGNSDLSSISTIGSLSYYNAAVVYNRVYANSDIKAMIENATGTFNINGLDIITDYGTMRAFSQSNLASVSVAGASLTDSGAYMNAKFSSGIDSSKLTINNKGATKIETAKSLNGNSILAEAVADSVGAGLAELGISSAIASNTAKSITKLVAKDHNSSSLNINAYLKSEALVSSKSASVSAVGLSSFVASAISDSLLTLDIGGKNTITGDAVITTNSSSTNSIDLKSFNFALLGEASTSNLSSSINSSTNVNFGGEYNANSTSLTTNTTRNSKLDIRNASAAGINLKSSTASNTIDGKSIINIKGLKTGTDANNKFVIKNNATNTLDVVMASKDYGLISLGSNKIDTRFGPKNPNDPNNKFDTQINIEDSDINSKNTVEVAVNNQNLIKDSFESSSGGIISSTSSNISHNYNSGANINIKNSNISAKDVKLDVKSAIKSQNGTIGYNADSSGFVGESEISVKNSLTLNNEINITNSQIKASDNVDISMTADTEFSQSVDAEADGFVGKPHAFSWLTVNNTNNLNIDSKSKILASNAVKINMDSNNTLYNYAHARVDHFAGSGPNTKSYIDLTINNNINNSGSIEAGKLVDIDFMNKSMNKITQDAYSEAYGGVATSSESGQASKTVNNTLNVTSGADISSGKDISITFSSGKGTTSSSVRYKCVSYLLFGIPITVQGSSSHIINTANNAFELNGDLIAGKNNNRYMKIDKYGNIIETSGFYDGDYELTDGKQLSGQELLDRTLAALDIEISNLGTDIEEIQAVMDEITTNKEAYEKQLKELENTYNKMSKLLKSGYTFKTQSEIQTILKNDLIAQLEAAGLDKDTINDIFSKYQDLTAGKHAEELPSLEAFLQENYTDLTAEQISIFTKFVSDQSELVNTENGFAIYGNYIISEVDENNKTYYDHLADAIDSLGDIIDDWNSQFDNAKQTKDTLVAKKDGLTSERDLIFDRGADYYEQNQSGIYGIWFNDIITTSGTVNISGIQNTQITGNGNITIAETGLKIDNYSSRSLFFGIIDLSANGLSGLYINGESYADYIASENAVNKAVDDITRTNGVHYKNSNENGFTGITITNYYDSSNPFAETQKDIPNPTTSPDITFNGSIASNAGFDVWNESGNITLNSTSLFVNGNMHLTAVQGDVTVAMDGSNTSFNMKSGDSIFAGGDVDITATQVNIANGSTIEAGYTDRKLVITEDMLQNLVEDPTTGEINMIKLTGDNNIKAIYKNGQIYLFNIRESGGRVTINGSGNVEGTIKTSDGYQNITITNNTTKQLNIGDISNNRHAGGFVADSRLNVAKAKIENRGYSAAKTTITSQNGKVVLDGIIQNSLIREANGSLTADNNKDSKLTVVANNGLDITQQSISGVIVDSILAGGTVDITSSGLTNINGNITNTGVINITKNGDGAANITSVITQKGGDINITNNGNGKYTISGLLNSLTTGTTTVTNNSSAGFELTATGTVQSVDADIKLNNTVGTFDINGTVVSKNGDISVNNSTGTTNINGSVTNENGDIEITNASGVTNIVGPVANKTGDISINNSTGTTNIDGSVTNEDGDIDITNEDGTTNISSTLANENGNIDITNEDGTTNISGTLANENGNIDIANASGETNIVGSVANKNGGIDITNTDGATNIAGTVANEKGNISVLNKAGTTDIKGLIENNHGKIDITNESQDGLTVANGGKIRNAKGKTTITNSGLLTVEDGAKVVSLESGDISINNRGTLNLQKDSKIVSKGSGDISIDNKVEGQLTFEGIVKNTEGDIDITNDSENGLNFASSSKVKNVKGNTTITNNAGDLIVDEGAKIVNTEGGNIKAVNNSRDGGFTVAGSIKHNGKGNIALNSVNGLEITSSGVVGVNDGTLDITNSNEGSILVEGTVKNSKGKTNVKNTSEKGGIKLATTGSITNTNGDITLDNSGSKGITIEGLVTAENQDIIIKNKDSDITIGEYDSDNDFYINAKRGNVKISQTNGSIINGIVDPDESKKHQNHDLGNPDKAYKTLIASGKDLIMDVVDGDIGSYNNEQFAPGFTIDAKTRDYTDSINVNIGGSITAHVSNKNSTDARLANIRAKESDMRVKDITVDGNIILTAADWRVKDEEVKPTDASYYEGYSIFSTAEKGASTVKGQNISVIASNQIGTDENLFSYTQDTEKAPNSSVSFMSENDIHVNGSANSENETKIYQIVSKRGNIELILDSNALIKEITAGNGLSITQKAQNLTIIDLGMPVDTEGTNSDFEDLLKPHDGIVYKGEPVSPDDAIIPNYIDIKVLDAMTDSDRSDSNLTIYSAYVRGNHGEHTQYNPDGSRKADVSLMADNIYAASDKAPGSNVSTKSHPNGYKPDTKKYSESDFGGNDDTIYSARGINSLGEGDTLTIDIVGVDDEVVNNLVENPQRRNDNTFENITPESTFQNAQSKLAEGETAHKAKHVEISVNDYAEENRGVEFERLYADNAYVDTQDTYLSVKDGYINNYAEFRNRDKIGVVDNDYHRIVKPADIQLYTRKTGSFSLTLDDTINMQTTAPTVYNHSHKLVNGYHSQWNFVRFGLKNNKDSLLNIDNAYALEDNKDDNEAKRTAMRFDTTTDLGLNSNFEIYDISTTGALIKSDSKLKVGKKTVINLKFDDVDITLNAKIVNREGNKYGVEFLNIPQDIANKILYRYMQQADATKINKISYENK